MFKETILEEEARKRDGFNEFKGTYMIQIPIEEYNKLREENWELRGEAERLDHWRRNLEIEIRKKMEVEDIIRQECRRAVEEIKRLVSGSDTEKINRELDSDNDIELEGKTE